MSRYKITQPSSSDDDVHSEDNGILGEDSKVEDKEDMNEDETYKSEQELSSETDTENNVVKVLGKKSFLTSKDKVDFRKELSKKQTSIKAMFTNLLKPKVAPDESVREASGDRLVRVESEVVITSETVDVKTSEQDPCDDIEKEDESESDDEVEVKVKKPTKRIRNCKVSTSWFQSSKEVDQNGDPINTYLRTVPGKSNLLFCSVCASSFSVQFKGKSAINRHAESKKHTELMNEMKNRKEKMGIYLTKGKKENTVDAEIALARFAAAHNISLKVIPHLVKTLKKCFQDSPTCQMMGSLSASRMSYGLRRGLGKTEIDSTLKDLTSSPFSLQMDGGLKGGKHRENFLVRYFDEKVGQVVDKFILSKTCNTENAKVVADFFLSWCKKEKVDIKHNLIMVNTDHASTLRGHTTGAVARISELAPNVKTCDIGGDILHDINNSTKGAFYKAFPNVVKILDITKNDLGRSSKKTETFLSICSHLGLDTIKPKKWCRSRFLSRYDAVKERRKRLVGYSEFYMDIQPPCKRRKGMKSSGRKSFLVSSEESSSSDSSEEDIRKPNAKKIVWIKEKLGDKLDETTVEFEGAIDVLKESDTLLRVFQHQQPTVHVIKASILELAKNCFLNITAPNNLLHSDGTPLGGKSLQNLHFETEEAKIERKAKDIDTEKQIQELTEEERKLKASIKSNNFFEKSSAEQKLSKVAQRKRK